MRSGQASHAVCQVAGHLESPAERAQKVLEQLSKAGVREGQRCVLEAAFNPADVNPPVHEALLQDQFDDTAVTKNQHDCVALAQHLAELQVRALPV